MPYLALILLLTFLVIAALMWGLTRWLQGMLYENVEPELLWRAPAAAGAVTAFVGLWAVVNYLAFEPGQTDLPYDTIFNFTTEKDSEPVANFEAVRGSGKVKYRKVNLAGSQRVEYRTSEEKLWLFDRETDVKEVIVKEGDRDVTFKADPNLKRYVEEGGRRYIDMANFGRITTPRGGGSWVPLLFNVLLFVVWFACLWVLLRFQWPHALGLAVVMWLVMTFAMHEILRASAHAKPAKVAAVTRRSEPEA